MRARAASRAASSRSSRRRPGPEPEWPEEPPYDIPLPDPVPQVEALAHATVHAARLFALEAMGAVRVVRGTADLDRAAGEGRIAAVLHLEGAEALDPGLATLDAWYEAGLRSLGLVWSRANAFAPRRPVPLPRLARRRARA